MEEIEELSEEEFLSLDDENQWRHIKDLYTKLKELAIKAEKNCSECKKYLITPSDLNIQYFMEDWRDCRQNCDKCGKEERVMICEAQYQIINHIINEMIQLRNRQNGLVEFVLKRGEGKDMLKDLEEEIEKSKKMDNNSKGLYL